MEIPFHTPNLRVAILDAFLEVSPLTRELDGSFDSLHPGIHGQNHVIAEHLRDKFRIRSEGGVVECSGGQC